MSSLKKTIQKKLKNLKYLKYLIFILLILTGGEFFSLLEGEEGDTDSDSEEKEEFELNEEKEESEENSNFINSLFSSDLESDLDSDPEIAQRSDPSSRMVKRCVEGDIGAPSTRSTGASDNFEFTSQNDLLSDLPAPEFPPESSINISSNDDVISDDSSNEVDNMTIEEYDAMILEEEGEEGLAERQAGDPDINDENDPNAGNT